MALELTESLAVDGVSRQFRNGHQVGPITFSVRPGTCFALLGSNGAGKSTLMRIILGLDEPSSGEVRLFGNPREPYVPTPRVSGMIEEPKFFDWLSAQENLRAAFGRDRFDAVLAEDVLRQVGLTHAGDRRVRAFSQGMRQRLGIARVLLAEPDLFVLDEPTNGLDPHGIRWLRELIRGLAGEGKAVLLSSHLLHEVQQVADEFLMIEDGRPVASGTVSDIYGYQGLEDLYLSVVQERSGP